MNNDNKYIQLCFDARYQGLRPYAGLNPKNTLKFKIATSQLRVDSPKRREANHYMQ